MKIAISSGHSHKVQGAVGLINEVTEARKVADKVGSILKAPVFHDNTSTSQSVNLATIVGWHNKQTRDLDVSVHFNHSGGGTVDRAIGTEVLFFSQEALSKKVSKAISDASGLINRGAKKRTDLSFLAKTNKPAILIEVCFVNSRPDVDLYRQHFDKICSAIARTL